MDKADRRGPAGRPSLRSSRPTRSRSPYPRTTRRASRRSHDLADAGRRSWSSARRRSPAAPPSVTMEDATGVDALAGQRGVVGHRRAGQGRDGRGRRRPGLRHRRDRGGRRRPGRRVPRVRPTPSTSTRSPPSTAATTPTWPRSSSTWSSPTRAGGPAPTPASRPRPEMSDPRDRVGVPRWIFAPAAAGAAFVAAAAGRRCVLRTPWDRFAALITSRVVAGRALAEPADVDREHAAVRAARRADGARAGADAASAARASLRSLVLLPLVLPPVVGGHRAALHLRPPRAAGALARGARRRRSPSPPRRWCWRRRSWPCRSWWSASRARCARPASATRRSPRRSAPGRRRCSAGSPCRWCCPALASGAVLSFARSLGEFGATITFAGSLQGTTRTLPLEIYLQRETDPDGRGRAVAGARRGRGARDRARAPGSEPGVSAATCEATPSPTAASTSPSTSPTGETLALLGPNGAGQVHAC